MKVFSIVRMETKIHSRVMMTVRIYIMPEKHNLVSLGLIQDVMRTTGGEFLVSL